MPILFPLFVTLVVGEAVTVAVRVVVSGYRAQPEKDADANAKHPDTSKDDPGHPLPVPWILGFAFDRPWRRERSGRRGSAWSGRGARRSGRRGRGDLVALEDGQGDRRAPGVRWDVDGAQPGVVTRCRGGDRVTPGIGGDRDAPFDRAHHHVVAAYLEFWGGGDLARHSYRQIRELGLERVGAAAGNFLARVALERCRGGGLLELGPR